MRKRKKPEFIPRPELATLSDRTFVLINIFIEAVLIYWVATSKN